MPQNVKWTLKSEYVLYIVNYLKASGRISTYSGRHMAQFPVKMHDMFDMCLMSVIEYVNHLCNHAIISGNATIYCASYIAMFLAKLFESLNVQLTCAALKKWLTHA